MLDESICPFRGIGSISSLLFCLILFAHNVDPVRRHIDLCLHCLPMTIFSLFPSQNGLKLVILEP